MIEFAGRTIQTVYKDSTYYRVVDLGFMFDVPRNFIETYFDINARAHTTTYGGDLYVTMYGFKQMLLKTKATYSSKVFAFVELEDTEPLSRSDKERFKIMRELKALEPINAKAAY